MKRALATSAALLLLAGGAPALAATKAPAKYAACKAPAGAIVVKPGKETTLTPETPVGLLGEGTAPVGEVYLDLGGKPLTTKATLSLQLDWDNPLGDYDLVVDGDNPGSTDQPEVYDIVGAKHCKPVAVETNVFLGTPVDELTFTATAR